MFDSVPCEVPLVDRLREPLLPKAVNELDPQTGGYRHIPIKPMCEAAAKRIEELERRLQHFEHVGQDAVAVLREAQPKA